MQRIRERIDVVKLMNIAFILMVVFAVTSVGIFIYLVFHPDLFKILSIVVTNNFGYMLAIASTIGFGMYKKITNPIEFTWMELPFQLLACIVCIYITYMNFFYLSSDISDKEILNGYALKSQYYEEWKEEVTWEECDTYDKDHNCTHYVTKSRIDYHSPYWRLILSTGTEMSISSGVYENYKQYFQNEKKEYLYRANQVSFGDGNMYETQFSGKEIPIWTAQESVYGNLRKADSSILLQKSQGDLFQSFLVDYPQVYSGKYGEIEIDRVIDPNNFLPKDWKRSVDNILDKNLAFLGERKKVNILVYVVNTPDQMFYYSLENHWIYGKQNDVIVVIGASKFPKVDWVTVMSWTDQEIFKIQLRDEILNMSQISNPKEFTQVILKNVSLSPENGGYSKKPLTEYNYLASSVKLTFWQNMTVFLIVIFLNFLTTFFALNNQTRNRLGIKKLRKNLHGKNTQ